MNDSERKGGFRNGNGLGTPGGGGLKGFGVLGLHLLEGEIVQILILFFLWFVWVQVVSVQAYGAFVRLDGHDLDG
jgi:hypothetical protein